VLGKGFLVILGRFRNQQVAGSIPAGGLGFFLPCAKRVPWPGSVQANASWRLPEKPRDFPGRAQLWPHMFSALNG
jgi:hypothetical protein